MTIIRSKESKRLQAATDREWDIMQSEKITTVDGSSDGNPDNIFFIEADFQFLQYISCDDGFMLIVDGDERLGPFKDHVESIKILMEMIIKEQVKAMSNYRRLDNMLNKEWDNGE